MTSIGERLREERLRRGLGIEQIAEQLKINSSMLTAIETGDLDRLPAGLFRRSFVRQYARALGLPDSEIDAEVKRIDIGDPGIPAAHAAASFRPDLEGPITAPRPALGTRTRGGSPQPLGSLIAFLLIVAACTGLYALWERTRQPAAEPRTTVHSASPGSSASKPAPVAPVPALTQQAAPAAQSPAQAAPQPAVEPPAQPSAAPQPAAGPVSVVFRAKAEVWLRIRAGGKLLFEGTLEPEETRTFEGPEITARIGRPGSVSVMWNGKPAPLQPSDTPLTLEFTPETYRIVPPQPAATPPDGVL